VSTMFYFLLTMGAGSFLAIQYVVGAKWIVAARRVPESIASFAPVGGVLLLLVLLLGASTLYPWAAPDRSYPYEGTVKASYLSLTSHYIRMTIYVGLLSVMTFLLVRGSNPSTERRADVFKAKRLKLAIIYLIIFTFVSSFLAWEGLMSLEPKWFSSIFGVYIFAGAFLSALALMMLMSFGLRSRVPQLIAKNRQMYDLGTYVMGFSVFWIYIAFSQFMIIWYANIPDEIAFYLRRYEGTWLFWSLLLPTLKWLIPFFLLMPPTWRTNRFTQTVACLCILAGQIVDLWWIVGPAKDGLTYYPTVINIVTFFGMTGLFAWGVSTYLASNSLVPVKDPDLLSSVNGEYLHA